MTQPSLRGTLAPVTVPELQPTTVVTGGAGFIGSHTVEHLLARGHRVIVLDDLRSGKHQHLPTSPQLHWVECDVSQGITAALAPFADPHQPFAAIVHLAAQVSVLRSIAEPVADAALNYGATLHVLEYARSFAVGRVVFASSSAVYGDLDATPASESMPCRPRSPYGIHKYASELALDYYSAVHGVASTVFRCFNVYGPRQDPSNAYSGVISIFAAQAAAQRDLTIFGDGQQTRDFIHVHDVARALVRAAEATGPSMVLNLGTGVATRVSDLAELVRHTCNSTSRIVHAAARPGEVVHSCADITRATAALGLPPPLPLAHGLAQLLG